MKPTYDIGSELRHFRKHQRITQEELARRTGLGQGTIAKLENGTYRNPKLSMLSKLAKELGCRIHIQFRRQAVNPCPICSPDKEST